MSEMFPTGTSYNTPLNEYCASAELLKAYGGPSIRSAVIVPSGAVSALGLTVTPSDLTHLSNSREAFTGKALPAILLSRALSLPIIAVSELLIRSTNALYRRSRGITTAREANRYIAV